MPPYRVNPPQRVNSLPTMSADNDLSLMPSMTPTRASCDPCRKRKLRCTGPEPREGGSRMCERCFSRGEICVFSARKPMGRPRTVSSTPPSPSPCFSQPTTPPPPPHHNMTMSAGKHHPQPHYDMYPFGTELPSSATMGFQEPIGWAGPLDQPSASWMLTPLSGTPSSPNGQLPLSAPGSSLTHTPMLVPVASDSFLGFAGEGWENESHHSGAPSPYHRHNRTNSLATSEFMYESSLNNQSSVQQYPFNESAGFLQPTHCFCNSGFVIDDLRLRLRDVAAEAPAPGVGIALGAASSLTKRCVSTATCNQCMNDQSTGTVLISAVTLVVHIFQHVVAALPNKDGTPIVGSFGPAASSSTANFAAAVENEIESLRHSFTSVVNNLGHPHISKGPQDFVSIESMVLDRLRDNLTQLVHVVSNVKAGNSMPLGWEAGQPQAPPAWEGGAMPLTV